MPASPPIDLNQLRDLVHRNQAAGNTNPTAPRDTIVVDREGRLRKGDQVMPGMESQTTRVQQDTFHAPVPRSFSTAIRAAANELGAEVITCDRRSWNEVILLASDFLMPGGISLLILAADSFPGVPPLVFVTVQGSTSQLQIDWDLGVNAEARLGYALRGHFHGDGPFRSVYGPKLGLALTDAPEVAARAGWQRFFANGTIAAVVAESALHARSGGLLSSELSHRHVFICGLGSGGSYVAEQLVRAGVGQLTLVDPDIVEPANLSRTTYQWQDVGLHKCDSLAARLLAIRPDLNLHLHPGTLASFGDGESLVAHLRGCDLILALTDSPQAQSLLNQAAWHASTPAIFAALYAGAKGGEVILNIPGRTPCYSCATGKIREVPAHNGHTERDVDYGSGRLTGETALAADIHHLDTATVKLALSLLVKDLPNASLSRFAEDALAMGYSYLCLSMEPDYWFFPHIFGNTSGQYAYQGVWLGSETNPECAVCGDACHRNHEIHAIDSFDITQFPNIPPIQ